MSEWFVSLLVLSVHSSLDSVENMLMQKQQNVSSAMMLPAYFGLDMLTRSNIPVKVGLLNCNKNSLSNKSDVLCSVEKGTIRKTNISN